MGGFRSILNWYSRLSPNRHNLKPPYGHITQIGDPILRRSCDPVERKDFNSKELNNIISKMKYVMNKYNCVGLAAPQIGVNKRIVTLEYTAKFNQGQPNEFIKKREIYLVPFTVLINPTLKVLDYTVVSHTEGCESIKGYHALVPHFQAIEVTGYNEKGDTISKQYEGWAARMAQHEIDHLDGKFYIDIMDKTTFECTCWQEVNFSRGKVELPFYP